MHPPEPVYPCYLPVLGEFNRMTPHEGPSDTLPEHGARLESAPATAFRPAHGRCGAGAGPEGNRHESPLRISAPPAIMCMYTDWGNLKVVSCVAWRNGTDPAAQRCTGNGRIGGAHFQAKRQPGTRSAGRRAAAQNPRQRSQLGDAENFK